MNKKGFTLVELLVTVAVLGIITGLSIPLIRNVQTAQAEKKYTLYLDTVDYAAKAYTDSYSMDLFNNSPSGCAFIYYNDLQRYNLIKDINITNMSCNSDYTIVKVIKYQGKYYYNSYIGCGTSNGGKVTNPSVFKPTKAETSTICGVETSARITFVGTPEASEDITYKIFKPQVSIHSETGVKDSPPQIEYAYSYTDDVENLNVIGSWKTASFKIAPEYKQLQWIKAAKTQKFKSINSFSTPASTTGDLYLILKVNLLRDLSNEPWRTDLNDKYFVLGPYRVDNEAPSFNDSRVVSSNNKYNSTKPMFDLKVTDEHYTPESDLKTCYTYDSEDACPIPSSVQDLEGLSPYKKYKRDQTLTKIADDYDGSTHQVHVNVSDAAGNVAQKTFDYRVSKAYKLTFDSDGGSTCNPAYIRQIENYAWKESVSTESGLDVHTFCNPKKTGYTLGGWYTAKNGGGTQVKDTDKATKDLTAYAKWVPKTVKVTFDCNGGATTGTQTFTYGVANQKFSYTCSRNGYTLDGWTFNDNGTTRTYTVNNGVSDAWIDAHSPSVTIKAKWTPITYTITYNLNGGTVSPANKTTYTIETANFTLNNPTKTGYTFAGWTGTGLSNATKTVTINKGSTGNRSYTATYTAKTITVTFDCNGGTGGGSSTYTYGVSGQKFNKTCSRNGYTLAGWTFNDNGTTRTYEVANAVSDSWIEAHSPSATIKAKWTPITYTITYNLNGGTVSSANKTSYTIETANFTLNNPTKTGYTFAGWTGTGLSGATKSVTINKGSTGNRTYTATYTVKTVTVTFNCNGGTGGGSSTYTYGTSGQKFNKTCSKNGYTLAGWTFDDNGTTRTYTVNNGVSDAWIDAHSPSATVKAKWTATNYTITYNLNGGTVSPANKTSYTIETATFTLNNPTRSGYTFAGWTGTGLSGATKTVSVAKGSTGNRTYTATWTPVTYTITYNLNGGSVSGNPASYTIETTSFTLKNPTRTGYTFAGWTGTGLSKASTSVTVAKGSTGNRTYTATWTTAPYTITYNLGGGTVSGNPTSYTIETATFTLNNPTKTGYNFAGWTGTGLSSATKTVTINKGSTGNRTYTATYTAKTITVTFNCNGGTGGGSSTYTYGVSGQKFNKTCSKNGYTLAGWTYNDNGTTRTYEVANGVSDAWINAHSPSATVTAKWTATNYTITYNLNGGTVSPANKTSYTIETASFTLNNPTKTGYNFAGWTGTGLSNATKTVTVAKGSTGNRTYTATYNPKTITVTFNCNGGTGGGSSTYTYGVSGQKFNKTCSKNGYTLAGWTYNDNGTTRTYTVANAVSDSWIDAHSPSATVTAKWSLATYTITYNLNGGTVATANPTSYTATTNTFTLNNPSKTGYTFAGWTGTGLSNATKTVTINKGSSGNRSYTATYTANTFTVTYNGNGNTGGSMTNTTCTYDAACSLRSNGFTKSGYTFIGWATSTTGNVVYANGANVKNAKTSGTLALYARWKSNNITFRVRVKSGETYEKSTVYNGSTSNWTDDGNGILYRNGSIYGAIYSRGTNVIVDLPNHGYAKFIKITKKGYGATWETAWKCESGCRRSNQTFSQGEVYMNLDDIVADNNLDGVIVLNVNWRPAAVQIAFLTNGGKLTSSPVNPSNGAFHDQEGIEENGGTYLGIGRYYTTSTGRIYKGDQNDTHHELAVGTSLGSGGLMDYNGGDGVIITKPSGKNNPASGREWKESSGCKYNTYSQSQSYTASDFCTPGDGDCLCKLKVNWR